MKKIIFAVVVLAVAGVPLAIGGKYALHVGSMIAITATLALSMNLMLRIGQVSMAQGAFMGMGAYSSALLTMKLDWSPMVAMLASAVVVGMLAVALGFVFLRIKGVFFVLLTYAFAQIVNLSIQEASTWTGGNNGLYGIPKLAILGFRMVEPSAFYLCALAVAVLAWAVVHSVFRSRIGAILDSIEQDEGLSRALGTNALRWRVAVFGLSAVLASLAGSLFAHHLNFLSPANFTFLQNVDLLIMNIVGGVSSPTGAVLGALILVPLPELLRDAKQYELLIYGGILLGSLLFLRDGLVGRLGRLSFARRAVQTMREAGHGAA
jgi:branched-chain amino acid transport system permease protein